MARLHSKKKGKSGTKRPKDKAAPEWISMDEKEIKETILKMAREGIPPAKIGLVMRDQHGIANLKSILGMSVVSFLEKEGITPEYPADLLDLIKKAVRMSEHIKQSNKDVHNKVKLSHVESKIQRLVRYYTKEGVLPAGWKYERDKAALLVK